MYFKILREDQEWRRRIMIAGGHTAFAAGSKTPLTTPGAPIPVDGVENMHADATS